MTPDRRRELQNKHSRDLTDADLIEWLNEHKWRDHLLGVAADRIEALRAALDAPNAADS